METKKPSYEIGRVLTTKNGGLMLEVTDDVNLKKGERFFLNDFLEDLERSVNAGYLTAAKAEDLATKLNFVKYKVVRPAVKKS